jgi:hypothetical protein
MQQRIIVEVVIDVEQYELDAAMQDLEEGIENHVAVGFDQDEVIVLSVQESPSVVAVGEAGEPKQLEYSLNLNY